jgi:hypothetical protein
VTRAFVRISVLQLLKDRTMPIHTHIATRSVKEQRFRASRAVATYQRTKAYQAALYLTRDLLRRQCTGDYQVYADAARFFQIAGSIHTPERVLQWLIQFALEFLEAFNENDRDLNVRQELGSAFVKLIPQRLRGGAYIKQRTHRLVGEMIEESVWGFCFRLARLVKETEGKREAALKDSLRIREEISR